MDIIKQLEWRYAVKSFSSRIIPDEKIDRIERGLQLTASSYGLQFMKYVWVNDTAIRRDLLKHSYNQQQIVDASHLLVLCRSTRIDSAEITNHIKRVSKERQRPIESLNQYANHLKTAIDGMTANQRREWMINQIYLAMGNLLTLCAAEEIDACPMEGFVPQEYDAILDLDKFDLSSVLICPIGYRSNNDNYAAQAKVRKSRADLFISR
jgi:nitroreductase